jgi:hypothetical protein
MYGRAMEREDDDPDVIILISVALNKTLIPEDSKKVEAYNDISMVYIACFINLIFFIIVFFA